jgi:hypothetical protein
MARRLSRRNLDRFPRGRFEQVPGKLRSGCDAAEGSEAVNLRSRTKRQRNERLRARSKGPVRSSWASGGQVLMVT